MKALKVAMMAKTITWMLTQTSQLLTKIGFKSITGGGKRKLKKLRNYNFDGKRVNLQHHGNFRTIFIFCHARHLVCVLNHMRKLNFQQTELRVALSIKQHCHLHFIITVKWVF